MITSEEIKRKLSEVIDPELGVNIVDLGLIYGIEFDKQEQKPQTKQKQHAIVKITFTTPACPLINDMLNEITEKLNTLKDIDIDVVVTFDPPWSVDMMSERAKIKMGLI